MTRGPTQPAPPAGSPERQAFVEDLDPANRSLADALRKSFRILKLLMLVLVVLYFLSGWFSVKPNEVGLVLRYGRIVGAGAGEGTGGAVLYPGWHWSWPYPFEQWITVSTSERQMPVEFMFQLSESERTTGITGYKYDNLSPMRDDYLMTGDVNIIHASLVVKYHVSDAIAYVTHVHPMPDPEADIRSAAYRRYPEYTILSNLARDAVIETAARREALKIRGEQQDAFLGAVAVRLNEKLKELEEAGTPLGIAVDPHTGIIAPKKEGVEAIMPPRQTQEVFDRVQAAESQKSGAITKARSEAEELLVTTAGPGYRRLAEAIEAEFDLMLALSAAEAAGPSNGDPAEIQRLGEALARQRQVTERLLTTAASGNVRAVLQDAEIARDRILKEAAGDYEQFIAVLPEYLGNPGIFVSRLLDETYAAALDSEKVAKLYVPHDHKEVRLHIPRSGKPVLESDEEAAGSSRLGAGFR